jgi:tetratricopeptide (TPR) repeat protein
MKAKLPLFFLMGIALFLQLAFTENKHTIDSLNGELTHAKNPIRRLHFQAEIAAAMDDHDSAIALLTTVLNRSNEINEPNLILEVNKTLGGVYLAAQDLDSAAGYFRKVQFLANQMHDTLNQAEALGTLAHICAVKKDYKKSEAIFRNAETLLQTTGMPDVRHAKKMGLVLHQRAASFEARGMLDSARACEERSVAMYERAGSNTDRALGLISLASIQSRQNNHKGAIYTINLALETCSAEDYFSEDHAPIVAAGMSQLAMEYGKAGNFKMAQQKADSALLIARATNVPGAQVAAFRAMAAAKEGGHDYEQALHYYDSATVLNAQMLSDQYTAKIAYEQKKQVRQSEASLAEDIETAQLRKTDLQVVGIGIFLLTVLVFGVGVSLKKHGATVTKVLGAVALLLTFEFISLVVHPLLERWTHHSAIIMLLIMAVVAGVLVSLHHRIEDLIRRWFHTEDVQGT